MERVTSQKVALHNMHMYNIFYPELAVNVKFKVLDHDDINLFLEDGHDPASPSFKLRVLDNIVYNLHTNVLESLYLMSSKAIESTLASLYQGCVMLNPALDPDLWVQLSGVSISFKEEVDPDPIIEGFDPDLIFSDMPVDISGSKPRKALTTGSEPKTKNLTKTKIKSLRPFLRANLIGQDEAISAIHNSMLIAQAGLKETKSPIGVFLFAGASGVGKTLAAKLVQRHLFGDLPLIRLDCGEFQHKHENQKLLGAPPGYIGHDDGSPIFNQVTNNPNTVILLDEVEKAHPDFWNTFLHIFDEGYAMDNQGMEVDFSNVIFVLTTNLGNDKTAEFQTSRSIGFAVSTNGVKKVSRDFVEDNTNSALRNFFKPEFLNRIDDIIVFNHLTEPDLIKVAELEMQKLQDMVALQGIEIAWDKKALKELVNRSQNSVKGARDITSTRVKCLDRQIAKMMVDNKIKRGSLIQVNEDLEVCS